MTVQTSVGVAASETAIDLSGASDTSGILYHILKDVQHSKTAYAVLFAVITLTILLSRIGPEIDSREPEVIKPTFPVIGHVINMLRRQADFYVDLSNKSDLPIATLPMLNGKMYVILDPSLVQVMFRNKDLSFHPPMLQFVQRLCNVSDDTMAVFNPAVLADFLGAQRKGLMGDHAMRSSKANLQHIATALNGEMAGDEWHEYPNAMHWSWMIIGGAACAALYGPGNPAKDHEGILDDLWTYDKGMMAFVMNIMPKYLAAKAWAARERVQAKLIKYTTDRSDNHPSTSEFVKARLQTLRKYGLSDSDIGRLEIAMMQVSMLNTGPTFFWFVCEVFSRPGLMAKLREEVQHVIHQRSGNKAFVDIETLYETCGLLLSSYQEILRYYGGNTINREVLRDTTLVDDQGRTYLLKKGVGLSVSAKSTHFLERVWGSDAGSFRPDRFLDTQTKSDTAAEKAKKAAFVPFGGGQHYCPGRNFDKSEILGLMAVLVFGFEVVSLKGETVVVPDKAQLALNEAVPLPVDGGREFGLRIRRRPGCEKLEWEFKL